MLLNVGSPSARERIAADLDAHRLDLTLRKQILWESETATDGEVRAMEERLIRETGANDPAIGYSVWPRFSGSGLAHHMTLMSSVPLLLGYGDRADERLQARRTEARSERPRER